MVPLKQVATRTIRVPYALRRVPESSMTSLLSIPDSPQPGDIALARLEKLGRNRRLELANGRVCNLHEGDLMAVVFGHRYATEQFEAYARSNGAACDLLSMAGVCGLVTSKHAEVGEPSRLQLLGGLGDALGQRLQLRDFVLAPAPTTNQPPVIVVCGSAMDVGKTHTAMSLVSGLRRQNHKVASIKLTGTAAGRDTWTMLDAGAAPALDFLDGGLPSTYLCPTDTLVDLYGLLRQHASKDADWIVIEIADGLFQLETANLIRLARFTDTVTAWVVATGDPLAAAGAVHTMRTLGLEPLAISGRLSMSPLSMREAEAATGLPCFTAAELQNGNLNQRLSEAALVRGTIAPEESGTLAIRTA